MGRRPAWRGAAAILAALLAAGVPAAAAEPVRRLVTLAPHLAELAYEAGAGSRLVGVIAHSDFPPAVRALPRVGDAFGLDRETLFGLDPDLVLAWRGFTPQTWLRSLEADGHRVALLGADGPEDVADALVEIGRLAGTAAVAEPRARAYRERLRVLRDRYGGRPGVRVFVQLSRRPLYTVSDRQLIGQVVRLCGGRNVFGDAAVLTPVVDVEAVLAADPEIVFDTGGDPTGDPFADWRRFPALAATAADRFHRLTAEWITRPSLRLALGAEEVCALIDSARAAD